MSRNIRRSLLNEMAWNVKPISRQHLNETNTKTRIVWAEKHTKADFKQIDLRDEDKATLDGPDGWAKVWSPAGAAIPYPVRRQLWGGEVMFWAGMIDDALFEPYRVPEGVKLSGLAYMQFLD